MPVSSCWKSVLLACVCFEVQEYIFSSSFVLNVVHGVLVLLSGYYFFNVKIWEGPWTPLPLLLSSQISQLLIRIFSSKVKVLFSGWVVSDSVNPLTVAQQTPHLPGQNAGVGCHLLLQGISLTQGSNPHLPHCRRILYCLSPRELTDPHLSCLPCVKQCANTRLPKALNPPHNAMRQALALHSATSEGSEPQRGQGRSILWERIHTQLAGSSVSAH